MGSCQSSDDAARWTKGIIPVAPPKPTGPNWARKCRGQVVHGMTNSEKETDLFLYSTCLLLADSGSRREAIWNCKPVTGCLRVSAKRTVGVGVVRIGVGGMRIGVETNVNTYTTERLG